MKQLTRPEKIKLLQDVKEGKRKIKNPLLIVLGVRANPGHYHYKDPAKGYEDRIISENELADLEKYYEKIIKLVGPSPDEMVKHWKNCGLNDEQVRARFLLDYPTLNYDEYIN